MGRSGYETISHDVYVSINADGVPSDGTPVNITNTYKVGLVVVFNTLAIAGILFAVACLLFNVIFRNRK